MLREAEGALELVDVSGSLPALQRVPGLRTWGVQAKEGFFVSWDAALAVRMRLLLIPYAQARQPAHCTSRQVAHLQTRACRAAPRGCCAACSRRTPRSRWSGACACCRTRATRAPSLSR